MINKLLHKKRQYWENDFIEGVKSPEYAEAEKICKELGLIDEASSSDQIPSDQYGRIITIGKIFESKADLNMQVEE